MTGTGINERVIAWGGKKYTFRESGNPSAPAVIALHGLISHAGVWDEFSASLGDAFRVLALDMRGHGNSDWSEDYSQQAWVDDLGSFADALEVATFSLVGHSMGGRIAWLFAAAYPERVSRLIILDIAPMKPGSWPASPGDNFATLDDAIAAAREPRYARTDPQLFRSFQARSFKQTIDGRWTWRVDPRLRGAPREQPGFAASVDEQWRSLRSLRCPTLVVSTELNTYQPRKLKEEMVTAIPSASLADIAGADHDVLLEQPGAVAKVVREFLI